MIAFKPNSIPRHRGPPTDQSNDHFRNVAAFDKPVAFGKTAADYSHYRAAISTNAIAASRLWSGLPGQRILDLGTGCSAWASRGIAAI
jgi:hypothetical protein